MFKTKTGSHCRWEMEVTAHQKGYAILVTAHQKGYAIMEILKL